MNAALAGAGNPSRVWFETLVITIGGFALAHWVNPGNPLHVGAQFPWIWLAPILIALRYGVAPGVASVVVLLLGWLLFRELNLLTLREFPKLAFLGAFLVTLLCAEFAGHWQNRLRHLESTNAYGEERLQELTRKYFLLHLSHDRLYQNLIAKPVTLQDSLLRLRRLMAEEATAPERSAAKLPGLQPMLTLLTQICSLSRAAVYPIEGDTVLPQPLATVGNMTELDVADPLITYALEKRSAAHINMEGIERAAPGRYLIAVPLSDLSGEWLAMLAVERLPFFAYTQENLQILLAMVSYYADGLVAGRAIAEVQRDYPDCPMDFIDVLARVIHVRDHAGLHSSLVAMRFSATEIGRETLNAIRRTQRALDVEWYRERDGAIERILLMPMAEKSGVEGYVARTESLVQQKFNKPLSELNVTVTDTHVLGSACEALHRLLDPPA
jgi:hypothetical protein